MNSSSTDICFALIIGTIIRALLPAALLLLVGSYLRRRNNKSCP